MSQRLLDRLPKLLGGDSLLTAGNSCLINDGAAFVVLVSESWLKEHPEFTPKAEILGTCTAGGSPVESPRGAMLTADKLLARQRLSYEDVDAIEFNEAFAVIDVLFQRQHPDLIDRYNMLGGALAYGHPYGASGGIIMIHLLKALEIVGGDLGLMSVAGAGGMGQSILVRRL
jgi:acetyl-CoA C-acetyltransferase